MPSPSPYTPEYFSGINSGSQSSAEVILSHLFSIYRPRSVFDLGCGSGAWLNAAGKLGAEKLIGVDGPWNRGVFENKRIEFHRANVSTDSIPTPRCDLAMSTEVGEHVPPERSQVMVKALCAVAPVVLFSAAIPNQGGTDHINERWQSDWARMFWDCGFVCKDLIRPSVWHDQRVEHWYRENLLVYVDTKHELASLPAASAPIIDVVHPELFKSHLEYSYGALQRPSLRLCLQLIGRWFGRRVLGKDSR